MSVALIPMSLIIPVLNEETHLARTLAALDPEASSSVLCEVIVAKRRNGLVGASATKSNTLLTYTLVT